MADIKWIKMSTDLFNNRKIKQIRKLPDGDSIIGVWLQILCLAGDVNNGGLIYFAKDVPYTDEMLSTEFDRPLPVIRLALATFERFNMVEIIDDVLCVSNWEKYQSIDGLVKIQDQNRKRQQKFRENQKLLLSNVTCNVTDNVTVTESSISISSSISNSNNKDIGNSTKHKYGEYKNVKLTDEELQKLITEYGQNKTYRAIEHLSLYREEKGYKNKSDYLSMKRWVFEAIKEKQMQSSNPFKDKLKEMVQDEQNGSNGNHVGYQGGLSKLLQEPDRD